VGSHYTVTKDLYLYIGAWRWLYNKSKHVAHIVRKYNKYRRVRRSVIWYYWYYYFTAGEKSEVKQQSVLICCSFLQPNITDLWSYPLSHPRRLKKIGSYWPTFRDSVSAPTWAAWPMKMGSIGCPETSVTTIPRCVNPRKSEDGIYTAGEAGKYFYLSNAPQMFDIACLCSKVPRFCLRVLLIRMKWWCRWAWSVYKQILRKENRSTRGRGVLLLFVRAQGICPRCTSACRLIVLP
jgi:hypothetical protein